MMKDQSPRLFFSNCCTISAYFDKNGKLADFSLLLKLLKTSSVNLTEQAGWLLFERRLF